MGKSKFYWHAQEVSRCRDCVKPGLPPWGPHVRFRREQTLVREGSPLVKLRSPPDGRPQFGRAADVAAPLVERDAHLQPLLTHWVSSRIVPRTEAVHRMPVACGAGRKARTRTDEGAILP